MSTVWSIFHSAHKGVNIEHECGKHSAHKGVNFIGKLSNYHLKYYFWIIWKFYCRVQNNHNKMEYKLCV